MSTLRKYIPYTDIARIAPIMALAGEGIADVQMRVGCDFIINGGTYNMTTRELDSGLKIDGVLHREVANFGIGINKDGRLEWSYAGAWVPTWFGFYAVAVRGDAIYGQHLVDRRPRTGIGFDENGIILAATTDDLTTVNFGAKYFTDADAWINLDGGGSTQWISPEGKYLSGRKVVWYIGVWCGDNTEKESDDMITNLPVNGKFEVTAAYGEQNTKYWKDGHKGIDIIADNKIIYSPCNGKVRTVAYDASGWGWYISIGEGDGGEDSRRHILGHLAAGSIDVKVGDRVDRTTPLAYMGNSGNANGIHLHYQYNRPDKTPIDPTTWLHIPNKRGVYNASDYAVDESGELLEATVETPAHWAQSYYNELVAAGVIAGDETSKAWTQFDKPIGEITTGELLALIAKSRR